MSISKDYLKLFVKFLKEHNSLEKFKSNVNKIGYFNVATTLEFDDPLQFLFIFPWKLSQEGYDYWLSLYSEWYLILNHDRSKNSKRFQKSYRRTKRTREETFDL